MAAADLAALHTGQETHVFTSLTISQDAVTLFGFLSPASKRMFLQLQKVSGIGPKVALSLLSTLPPDRLAKAVADGDTAALSKAPGLGKKAHRRSSLNWQAASTSTRYGPKPMGRRKVATRSQAGDRRTRLSGMASPDRGGGRTSGMRCRAHSHPISAEDVPRVLKLALSSLDRGR